MTNNLHEALEENPIIAAIKDDAGLEKCLTCDNIQVVFILYGDICNIESIVHRIKEAGKVAMVHIDLISGLASKEIAVDYIQRTTEADGILSTRQTFVRRAKELGMYAILRVFVFDSMGLNTLKRTLGLNPDYIDILPGTMPKTLRSICNTVPCPILTGGLIADKEDVMAALDAGAVAISTTNQTIWEL